MNKVYKVKYKDLEHQEHIKYFSSKELAENYSLHIINEIKQMIINRTTPIYDRFYIELNQLSEDIKVDCNNYVRVDKIFDEYSIKRQILYMGDDYYSYELGYVMIDSEKGFIELKNTFTVNVEGIEIIESLGGIKNENINMYN